MHGIKTLTDQPPPFLLVFCAFFFLTSFYFGVKSKETDLKENLGNIIATFFKKEKEISRI